ncbi:MAG: translational GTPase TypA [Bacilli bacterium]|nr:translational GTPase TypA [Bacilli bacterium]
MNIKNIAIIAHVDHGKTTLVDTLLQASSTFRENEVREKRVMDSNDLEKERGITILAKNTAINYKDYRINILDTPGHADFSGEVERIMGMVDGVLLLVDAYEGTMPQTRFVLKKALENKLKTIVVINKVDREFANPNRAVDEVLDLFIELGADDEQLEFPVVYASAIKNTCSLSANVEDQKEGMEPLLDMILKEIPDPQVDINGIFQFQPALLDYNDYVGRLGIGRITKGSIKVGDTVNCIRVDGSIKSFKIQKLLGFIGLKRVEIFEGFAGDIVGIAGLADIFVGETITKGGLEERLPLINISEPTVQMNFGTNTSPFSGQEGQFVTARKIEDYLFKETEKDVSLRVERIGGKEEWIVSGRGELHLSILIENMRRLGYEFHVSRPRVIQKEIDGKICEPYEDLQIDCPSEYIGSVIEMLGTKHGELITMNTYENQTRLIYIIPSRGLISFNTDFMTATHGYGIMSHSFLEYRPKENIGFLGRKLGALVSSHTGPATSYACGQIEDRGELLIEPGTEVYEGMIVGICNREEDLAVNITREKQQTNQRSSTKDNTVVLKRPRTMSLENYLEFINDDELVEVTPKSIRVRKVILNTNDRKRYDAYHPKK